MPMKGLIWFRTDLRLDDNPALLDAIDKCDEVAAIYIHSENQWNDHNESNVKLSFLIKNLELLEKSLSIAAAKQSIK